jgi:hypothetical protein
MLHNTGTHRTHYTCINKQSYNASNVNQVSPSPGNTRTGTVPPRTETLLGLILVTGPLLEAVYEIILDEK